MLLSDQQNEVSYSDDQPEPQFTPMATYTETNLKGFLNL
jgi:hypothetical protein